MNTEQPSVTVNPRDSGEFRIVDMVHVSGHTYRVTTVSKRYGRVTQDVVCFPESILLSGRQEQHRKEPIAGR
jgi:hypothetical protein